MMPSASSAVEQVPSPNHAKVLAALVGAVKSRLEYIACLASSSGSLEAMAKASDELLQTFARNMHGIRSLRHEKGKELIDAFQSSNMLQDQKTQCIAIVHAKVSLDPAAVAVDDVNEDVKQNNAYVHEYAQASNKMIIAMYSEGADTFVRLRYAAQLARLLGCNHMNERTKARFTALAFPEADLDGQLQLSGQLGYDVLFKFKDYHEKIGELVPGNPVIEFPPFREFESKHPSLFAGAGYEAGSNSCYLSLAEQNVVAQVGAKIPLRETHTMVNKTGRHLSAGPKDQQLGLCGFRLSQPPAIADGLRRSVTAGFETPPRMPALMDHAPPTMPALRGLPALPGPDPAQAPTAPALTVPAPTQANTQTVTQMVQAMQGTRPGAKAAAKPKAKAAAKPKAKAAAKTIAKKSAAKPKAKAAAKTISKTKKPKPESVHIDASVSHVLARTGLTTYPKSKAFPYSAPAGIRAARAKAKAWLESMGSSTLEL